MSGDDNFLSRWSKRKREALEPPAANAPTHDLSSPDDNEAEKGEAEAFDLSLLPDLETLTGESDIQSFLHKAVPEALRNAALRKMWALDPSVRNYVGEALDYAYDWNIPGGVPGFGEIISNEQSAAFVRDLLAGPTTNENVIENAAMLDSQEKSPPLLQETNEQPKIEADNHSKDPEKTDLVATTDPVAPQPEPSSQAAKKQRHGGALPL